MSGCFLVLFGGFQKTKRINFHLHQFSFDANFLCTATIDPLFFKEKFHDAGALFLAVPHYCLFGNALIFNVIKFDDAGGGGRCHNLKNGRKPVKLQKERPAGCAGEGKQSKGN